MRRTRRGYRQDGFILIVVLGAVLMLSALLFGFNQRSRSSLDKADGFYRTEQAWDGAWAGVQIAVATIRDVNDICTDPQFAKLLRGENTFSLEDANCAITIAEENGLLNVNRLKSEDGELDRRRIDQFLRLIDQLNRQQKDSQRIGYGILPCVIDWIDGDDDVTCLPFVKQENTGAEDGYYGMRPQPYSCRNRPVDSLDELRWVKGMTSQSFCLLRPFLTCVGDGKININAAPKLVIQSLSEQIDAALAEMIVNQRKLRPFRTTMELRNIPGMTDKIHRSFRDSITISPAERFYRITSQGRVQDHKCTIEALLRRNTQAGTVDIVQYREQ